VARNPATVAALSCRKSSARWDILGVSPIFIPIRRDHASTVLDQKLAKFSTGSISFESASRLPGIARSQQPLVAT
jgi:hypothetical protein